jgi:hypothetical protein
MSCGMLCKSHTSISEPVHVSHHRSESLQAQFTNILVPKMKEKQRHSHFFPDKSSAPSQTA